MILCNEPDNDVFTVVGIDPGTHDLGFCRLSLDMVTRDVVKVYSRNITPRDEYDKLYYHTYGTYQSLSMEERIAMINVTLKKELLAVKPDYMLTESAFFRKKTPMTYKSLVPQLARIDGLISELYGRVPIIRIAPTESKRIMKCEDTSKESMKKALRVSGIMKYSDVDIDRLTEHEIDSIGIAYCGVLSY